MEMFIDAYDWVMVPNIYGMSQFADGGIMTTKPYISGSNYNVTSGSLRQGSIVASTGEMWMTGADAGIGGNISMALPYVRVTTEQKDKLIPLSLDIYTSQFEV